MKIRKGYAFDDVLLVPKRSKVRSRKQVSLSVDLGRGINIRLPFISANMKTITGPRMAATISSLGGLPILHRFHDTLEEHVKEYNKAIDLMTSTSPIGVSLGLDRVYNLEFLTRLRPEPRIICIDVAHGHLERSLEETAWLRKAFPEALLISGSVATAGAAWEVYEAGADVVRCGIGSGCLAKGSRILLSNGFYKNIEDIEIGERIINKNGEVTTVINKFCTGIKKVHSLRSSTFYKNLVTTKDHQFFVGKVRNKKDISNFGYVKALEKYGSYDWSSLNEDNLVTTFPRNVNFELPKTFSIPLYKRYGGNNNPITKTKLDTVISPTYESGFLFGSFLGDGHAATAKFKGSNIGSVRWYFGVNDVRAVAKLKQAVKTIFNYDLKVTLNKKGTMFFCNMYYKPLADYLVTFGKKTNKHLPPELLVDNTAYLEGLLDGLIESDGSNDGVRIKFYNTSPFLMELFNIVVFLVKGFIPNNGKREKSVGNLTNCNPDNLAQAYRGEINTTGILRVGKTFQVSKILDKEDQTLELPVYDLTVSDESHSFIANNCIVHNSICSTRIETGNGMPLLSSLAEIKESGFPGKIIADGGIKNAGHCVKALCFADAIMLGRLIAGTDEAPGEIISVDDVPCKEYVGSSTHSTSHIEGIETAVPLKGSVATVFNRLSDGIRSGCSYQGASNLSELKENPDFIEMSVSGYFESRPHFNLNEDYD